MARLGKSGCETMYFSRLSCHASVREQELGCGQRVWMLAILRTKGSVAALSNACAQPIPLL